MTVDMLKRVAAALIAALVLASSASAQYVNGKWQAPPKGSTGGGGQGVLVTKPAETKPAEQTTTRNRGATETPLRVIAAVQQSDGTVQADFGNGMETVSRSCGINAAYMPLRVVTIQRNTTPLQPAPGMQPAPQMQPAPGQAPQSTPALGVRSNAARASCYVHVSSRGWFATY